MSTVKNAPGIEQSLASAAARECDLSPAAEALLRPELKSGAFLARLAHENLWLDALRFAPFGLPRSQALWWGALCLWQCYRPAPAPEVDRCLQAVVAWLREPGEAQRREAYEAGRAARTTTPAGNLALAAFFDCGSLAPVGQPEVSAQPSLMPQTLGAALTLALKLSPRAEQAARQTDFVRLALEVMAGRWPLPTNHEELP
jgi:hypothetical protein